MPGSTPAADRIEDARPALVRILRHPAFVLWTFLFAIAAGLIVYSQTDGFVWDEGFHLVAAQLIAQGKTPYIDFCFPQTLLNAYLNAAVLSLFGQSWRPVHVVDALFVASAVALTADYIFRRFPDRGWRLSCAIVAACFVAFSGVVVNFGPVAQSYGTGLFLVIAAFRVAVFAAARAGMWPVFAAGLLAGAAAGSTLLTVPLIPVLFVWFFFLKPATRFSCLAVFTAGAILPFAPELVLLAKAPAQTFFNVVQYQALFRRVNWGDVDSHDFDVFTDWTISAQSLLLGLLALLGIAFVARKSLWHPAVRHEFYLAASLAGALGVYISTAHPTFGRYFIFVIPFAAIVASAGFYFVGATLGSRHRPFWPCAMLLFILSVSIAKNLFDDRIATKWSDYERIAEKVRQVTPENSEFLSDELVYFLLQRTPPSGLEFSYSHKIQLSPREEKLYHLISQAELKKQIENGRFATVETCKDDVEDDFQLEKYFSHKQDFDDCTVFWRKGNPPASLGNPEDSKPTPKKHANE